MKVLITGHLGFVGSHFWKHFADDVRYGVDIVEGHDVRLHLPHGHFDLAIHCAANVGGRAQIDDSSWWVARNMTTDYAFLDWARNHSDRTVLFSSSAAYPAEFQLEPGPPLDEDEIGREPESSYGWSKLMLEYMAAWAGVNALILRPFSGYSHEQSVDYPFSAILQRAVRRENPIEIWSNTVRDFIHIDDIVGATLALLDAGQTGPFNLCSGEATSFEDLALMMCEEVGYRPQVKVLSKHPGVPYRVGDPTRLHEFYRPAISLRAGILRGLVAAR